MFIENPMIQFQNSFQTTFIHSMSLLKMTQHNSTPTNSMDSFRECVWNSCDFPRSFVEKPMLHHWHKPQWLDLSKAHRAWAYGSWSAHSRNTCTWMSQEISKWLGVYCGYNQLTELLLTSWDIQEISSPQKTVMSSLPFLCDNSICEWWCIDT